MVSLTSATWPSREVWGANLMYDYSFESQWTSEIKFAGGCYGYSFGLVKSPVREGSQSARVINKGTEDNRPCLNSANHRAQINFHDNSLIDDLAKTKQPIWIGFSVYVPTDHPTNQDGGYIMMQLNGGGGGPEFSVIMNDNGNSFRIERAWAKGSAGVKRTRVATAQVKKGRWMDFVIYRERSWDNDGVTKVWIDGELVADVVGPNAIDYVAQGSAGTVRLATGIYWTTQQRNAEYTLFFDAVRVAEGPDGYDSVVPNGKGTVASGSVQTSTPPPRPSGLVINTSP